jgi:hypothetical protein
MKNMDKIAKMVRATLAADFDKVKILDVQVRSDRDSEGERILRVYVIFEGAPKDIDARKLSGAVRQVRPKLIEMGEDVFPLFSFIAKRDVGAGKFEPA